MTKSLWDTGREHRRCAIFVETSRKQFPSFRRSGIVRICFPEDAAPMGLGIYLVVVSTKMPRLRRSRPHQRQRRCLPHGAGGHGGVADSLVRSSQGGVMFSGHGGPLLRAGVDGEVHLGIKTSSQILREAREWCANRIYFFTDG